MSASFQELADAFVNWYYDKLNNKRDELELVYNNESLVTFQDIQIYGQNARGQLNIIERLLSEGLKEMTKKPLHVTAQPCVGNTVLICVQGSMRMSPEEVEELSFFENFVIGKDNESGGFFICNQVFSTNGV